MKKLNKSTVKHALPLTKRGGQKLAALIAGNILKAHEATGHTLVHEHLSKMHRAVQKACCDDARFNVPPANNSQVNPGGYIPKPYVVDITTPDEGGQHHAIIQTAKGELVRHGFDFNKDEGTATLVEGNSTPTERTSIYAREVSRHENMVKATQETISCRATSGVKLSASEPWVSGQSVSYIYAPGGVTTINAGFRKNESITCTVMVDEDTAKDLQDSFDFIAATEKQEPYADEDHEAKKATLRFPPGKVEFTYGTHRGEEGVIVKGAEPTSYGAEAVNGKTYASWSPEFATDADYSKAKCKKGHWTFPDGVRGSESNPARLIAVNFVTGALTNKPAFRNMPPVKAKKVELDAQGEPVTDAPDDSTDYTLQATWSDAAREAAAEAKRNSTHNTDDADPDYNKAYGDASYHAFDKTSDAHFLSRTAHTRAEHTAAGGAHMEASEAHKKAMAASTSAFSKSQHASTAAMHTAYAKKHFTTKTGSTIHGEATKATTPPADADTVKAADPTPLDVILARQSSTQAAVEQLAKRVPATATRAGLEAILARQTATGTAGIKGNDAEVVKAGAPMGNKNAAGHGEVGVIVKPNIEGGGHLKLEGKEYASYLSQRANEASSKANDTNDVFDHADAKSAHDTAALAQKKHGDKKTQEVHEKKSSEHWSHVTKHFDKKAGISATSTTDPTLETLYARVGANGQTR